MVQSPNVEAGSEVVWSVQVRADADNASLWAVDGREVALRLASELGVRADLYARKYELRFIVTAADAFSASGAALTVWEELVTDLALPAWAVSQVEINATVRVAVTT